MFFTGSTLRNFIAISVLALGTMAQAASQDADALAAITARNNQFRAAVVAQNAAAASEIYDNNVIFMAPSIPTLRGKAAVQSYFQQQIAAGVVDIQLTTESIRPLKSLDHSNHNLQYEEIGTNVLTFNFGGNLVQIPGKYIVIWDFDRGIKHAPYIFRDSFSFSVPIK